MKCRDSYWVPLAGRRVASLPAILQTFGGRPVLIPSYGGRLIWNAAILLILLTAATSALPPRVVGPLGLPAAMAAEQDPIDLFTRGDAQSGGISKGAATTQLFGVRARGSKIIYVLDRSRSMGLARGQPLKAAKAELIASLNDLADSHQFQIISYNEGVRVFNPFMPLGPKPVFGTQQNKEAAVGFIRSVSPAGGTNHGEAIRLALTMEPDVIFLLTDADDPPLTANELDKLQLRNRAAASIHVIEFGIGPFQGRHDFLVRLARQNNGQHVYVDVSGLAAGD